MSEETCTRTLRRIFTSTHWEILEWAWASMTATITQVYFRSFFYTQHMQSERNEMIQKANKSWWRCWEQRLTGILLLTPVAASLWGVVSKPRTHFGVTGSTRRHISSGVRHTHCKPTQSVRTHMWEKPPNLWICLHVREAATGWQSVSKWP